MHDNLQFAATLIAILGGIVFSRQDARRLESKIDSLRSDIRADMSILDKIAYEHHGRITKVEIGKQDKP